MDESHKRNVRFQAKVTCADTNQANGYPGRGEGCGGGEVERRDQEELLGACNILFFHLLLAFHGWVQAVKMN